MHVHVARFPGSPLSVRLGHASAHVETFGQVVLGRLCQLIRARALSGKQAPMKNAKL